MANLLTKAPRGTADLLPAGSVVMRTIETMLIERASDFGFRELRTPVFEHTELFQRGVGETTDVVQKEMYTFQDNGGRSVTLKPEGTAGAVRAFLEHGLFNEPMPVKLSYVTPCYRYEKPQAGRLREFHQFGVECFGSASSAQDAEIILLAQRLLDDFGLDNISLRINSIGCPDCRKKYQDALRAYFGEHVERLCDTCKGRLERNPMRILDCKSPVCSEIAAGAPKILDYLCEDCERHFAEVRAALDVMEIPYTVDPGIVRGLDYYTRTVFEFVCGDLGAQSTVLGGGRYDLLVRELGGPDTPACGFAMGLERLAMILDAQSVRVAEERGPALYVASQGADAAVRAMRIADDVRDNGFECRYDTVGRSLKAQMKYADKVGAEYTMVLGENELQSGTATLKAMATGESRTVELEGFAEFFAGFYIGEVLK